MLTKGALTDQRIEKILQALDKLETEANQHFSLVEHNLQLDSAIAHAFTNYRNALAKPSSTK